MSKPQAAGITTKQLLIIITVMTVAILEILDSTIVNVSLPNMMASLNADSTQITWVVTAYIVASAVVIPLTGFLNSYFGTRKLLLTAICGFLAFSMISGLAINLDMMIASRICMGLFGATLIPLSQSILRNTFSIEQQGKAMAIWGVGLMAAPVLGPTLGGYITEYANWRWIFYINVPFCCAAFALGYWTITGTADKSTKVDWIGLILMTIGAATLQIFLDQGNEKGWFSSELLSFIFTTCIIAFITFIIRGINKPDNIINLNIFKCRNFTISSLMLTIFAATIFSVTTIQPIYMETLLHYPIVTTGLIMAPRGIACAIAMGFIPLLLKHFNMKTILITGSSTCCFATFMLSSYNLQTDSSHFIYQGLIQGFGMGLFFVPLSILAIKDLPKKLNTEGSGLYSYGRMVGTSIGISLISTIISRMTQTNWHQLGGQINISNPNLIHWLAIHRLSLTNPSTISQLSQTLSAQAASLAYNDAFFINACIMLVLIPLTLLLKTDRPGEIKADLSSLH